MILVVGSGVAGLSCALAAAAAGADVELATPGDLDPASGAEATAAAGGNTALAQGGVAAALGPGDRPGDHAADTVAAGAGIVDAAAAGLLARAGAAAVRRLLADGFPADRDPGGDLGLGLEAAHGRPRVVHAGGDRTGAALHRFLADRVRAAAEAGRLVMRPGAAAEALVVEAGAVVGAVLRDGAGRRETRRAGAVVLATGGYAALFRRTSNHAGSRGDGILLAARAGALVADLEFVQFHPTVLHGTGRLVSEVVRGAGAVLRDGSGRPFMRDAHPRGDLAPRDVVSREIERVLRARGEDAVWLDATGIERAAGAGTLARRFPGITRTVAALGLDWRREPVPVSPAAHYTMGGVASDLDGRSSVPGLFVAGEVAATGVHGANRLASNSLLEGLVFGERAGAAAADFVRRGASGERSGAWEPRGAGFRALARAAGRAELPAPDAADGAGAGPPPDLAAAIADGLGIERDADRLRAAGVVFRASDEPRAVLAEMIRRAAEEREESRGAHWRADRPGADPRQARRLATRWVLAERADPSRAAPPRTGAAPSGGAPPQPAAVPPRPSVAPPSPRSLTPC